METRAYWKWTLAGLLGTAVLALLYFFPPDKASFYPRCVLFTITGLECPGCGGLRAVHHLLHGNLARAFQLNPLVVIFLPVVIGVGAVCLFRSTPPDRLLKQGWLWVFCGLGVLFAIARNLPVFAR